MDRIDVKTAAQYGTVMTPCSVSLVYKLLALKCDGKAVLDIGCATGDYLTRFSNKSVGIDYSITNISICKEKRLTVIRSDFNDGLPVKDKSFNVAFCSHVLEHVDSPLGLLRETHRILKDEGIVILAFPVEKSLVRLFLRDHYFKGHPSHLYSFSLQCIERLLNRSGFSKEKIFLDIPLLRRFNLVSVLRFVQILPKRFGLWISANFWVIAKKVGNI